MLEIKNFSSNIGAIVHKEGHIFIALGLVSAFLGSTFSTNLFWIALILTALFIYFFRDPIRVTPQAANLIIAPADGIIVGISEANIPIINNNDTGNAKKNTNKKTDKDFNASDEDSAGISGATRMKKISIFLSPLDVHVNRIPIDSTIEEVHHIHGKFFNASLDKASQYNERTIMKLGCAYDPQIKLYVVQIAGLIARRIVNYCKKGEKKMAGDKFGIIKFSSRVDLYIPLDQKIWVHEGQRCVGGETIICSLTGECPTEDLTYRKS